MTIVRTRLSYVICMLLTAGMASGCRPHHEPSEDAVLYYFRNAGLGPDGKVRRIWPEGQEYVDSVLKANAELQKSLAPLLQLQSTISLLPKSDSSWQEKGKIKKQLDDLVVELENKVDSRKNLLSKLGEAIKKTPKGLSLSTPEETETFVNEAWDALSRDGIAIRNGEYIDLLTATGRMHRDLLEAVMDCIDKLDKESVGLSFTDDACSTKVNEAYEKLKQHLINLREGYFEYADGQLTKIAESLQKIDRKGQRNEYEYLNNKASHFCNVLESHAKRIKAIVTKLQEEVASIRDTLAEGGASEEEIAKIEARLKSRELLLEQMEEVTESLREKAKSIVTKYKSKARGETAAGDK